AGTISFGAFVLFAIISMIIGAGLKAPAPLKLLLVGVFSFLLGHFFDLFRRNTFTTFNHGHK
ncbi:hypothetical protein LCGC14_2948470, partial [marine sediment metagenome]